MPRTKIQRLGRDEILEMIEFVHAVFAGTQSPEAFFDRWIDIAGDEDSYVRELWFSMSYYENDIKHLPESADYFKNEALSYAEKLRIRNEN